MIVVDQAETFILITQSDHASLSGAITKLWQADGLPQNPRREDILLAAREHDCGWREADSVPILDAERGRPYDFTNLPTPPRLDIWRRSTERWVDERPYAALLITCHARTLLGGREGYEELNAELDERYSSLLETTSVTEAEAEADYRFIHLADLFSLALCDRWQDRIQRLGLTLWPKDLELELDPFPLAGATTFSVSYREIPKRSYSGDQDLAGELARARWQRSSVRLAPRNPEIT